MAPAELLAAFWDAIEARDWTRLKTFIAPDVQVYWPASHELIQGAENFVAVQSEYPEGWSIRVLSITANGNTVVSEVEVPHEGVGVFRAVSIWEVQGGVIQSGREYWVTVGGDERPAWRELLSVVIRNCSDSNTCRKSAAMCVHRRNPASISTRVRSVDPNTCVGIN